MIGDADAVSVETIAAYEEAIGSLWAEVRRVFPVGQVVIRPCELTTQPETPIYAVVANHIADDPTLVSLLHENGKLWMKPVIELLAVKRYPEWVEDMRNKVLEKTRNKFLLP